MATLHPSNPWYNSHSQQLDKLPQPKPTPPQPKRSQSDTLTSQSGRHLQQLRRNTAYRTTTFERAIDLSPPIKDEIIIATVRITNSFRRASIEAGSDLPSRPPRRTFLRRMSTRLSSERDANKYTAIKMPRCEYKRWFARDRNGVYVGTEPEREWTAEDLDREFGAFQDMPLRSIPGAQQYGEGDSWRKGQEGLLRDVNSTKDQEDGIDLVAVGGEVHGTRRVDGRYLL